jgi:DNA-directed RNA polymerase specialized sigma24 family protein
MGRVRVGRGEVVVVARTSRYLIELSVEERGELERRAREATAPWRDVQRARMILYASEGLPDKEVAARLDCHPEIVSRWRRRFCEQRIEGLQDKPRVGRPRRFPPGAGRRGDGAGLRVAGHAWAAARPLHAY